MKRIEKQRFEFLLLINGNIICQRYFDIRDFNEDSTDSLDMKTLLDKLTNEGETDSRTPMGIIPNHLKRRSRMYLWGYYKEWEEQTQEDIKIRDIHNKKDVYGFQIRIDGRVVAESIFTGVYFPPKVRYQVDIKEIIPEIISEIRYYLSKNSPTEKYGDISLKYDYVPYTFRS